MTVISCIISTVVGHNIRILIAEKNYEHDKFMFENFKILFDNQKANFKLGKKFIVFLVIIYISYFWMLIGSTVISPNSLNFMIRYTVICHFTHVHNFEMYCFMVCIEKRLKIILQLEYVSENDKYLVYKLKKALIQIYDLIQLINSYFKPCFIQTVFLLNFCLMINLYWIFLALLGIPYSGLIENIMYTIPNLLIMLCFGHRDRKMSRNIAEIIAISTRLKLANKEDILSFLLKKEFHFSAFKLVNFEFSTFGGVRKVIKPSEPLFVTFLFSILDSEVCCQLLSYSPSISNF